MYLECTDDVDIAGRSSAMGVKQGYAWGKQAIFEQNVPISRKR